MSEKLEKIQKELDVLAKPSSNIAVYRDDFQDLIGIVKKLAEEQLRLSQELEGNRSGRKYITTEDEIARDTNRWDQAQKSLAKRRREQANTQQTEDSNEENRGGEETK